MLLSAACRRPRNGLALALLALVVCLFGASPAAADGVDKMRQDVQQSIKAKLEPLLMQYCKEACSIVEIKVAVDEDATPTDDLGFEGVEGNAPRALSVSKIICSIQVDDRVSSVNRDRLLGILQANLQDQPAPVEVRWRPVTIPQFGQSAAKEEELKHQLEQRVSGAVAKVIEIYCPDDCVLSQVTVDGKLVTPDEASSFTPEELVHDRGGEAILRVEQVDVEVAMNEALPAATRTKITNVMKAKLRFTSPVNLAVEVAAFPEAFSRQQEKEQKAAEDPYGLEKLRQTLKIFRELASTKEILTTNNNTNTKNETAKESSNSNLQSNSKSLENEDASRTPVWHWMAYLGGFMLLGGIILFILLRFANANRDANMMMYDAQMGRSRTMARPAASAEGEPRAEGSELKADNAQEQRRDMSLRLKNEELRNELNQIFSEQPRIAKETFTRLLTEDGVEETARYIHIFGQLVIFELLQDPNLQRELYELSEYYHKSAFDFNTEVEHKLLTTLKTRVTATEIRVLTRRQTDRFDFLLQLDAVQIYNLIVEEKPQVQSIIMTQLDPRRRRAVFEMYTGEPKIHLLRELCRAEPIPKEFLSNIATALQRKVTSRPEFDVENLRTSEILFDLMDKATLKEQQALMKNLMQSNPEAARGIKLKLVTVELMPYLKDGHLLEIILGMEREDLLTFLSGAPEHIRDLLLQKAPSELAGSWVEDLENFHGGEQNYQFVEMKVTSRIRNLAKNGSINLLELNDLVFGEDEGEVQAEEEVVAQGRDFSAESDLAA